MLLEKSVSDRVLAVLEHLENPSTRSSCPEEVEAVARGGASPFRRARARARRAARGGASRRPRNLQGGRGLEGLRRHHLLARQMSRQLVCRLPTFRRQRRLCLLPRSRLQLPLLDFLLERVLPCLDRHLGELHLLLVLRPEPPGRDRRRRLPKESRTSPLPAPRRARRDAMPRSRRTRPRSTRYV